MAAFMAARTPGASHALSRRFSAKPTRNAVGAPPPLRTSAAAVLRPFLRGGTGPGHAALRQPQVWGPSAHPPASPALG